MQRIPRKELTRFEPKRVLSAVVALAIGPWLGVYLESRVTHWLPYGLTVGCALLTIAYFRLLGLHRDRLRESQARSANPLRHIRRYFSQPRLRLAWWLTVARSSWWSVFIIYTPIYAEHSGQGELVGAAVISIGTAWALTIPVWGFVGRTYGVRRLVLIGFVANALTMTAVFLFRDHPPIVIGLLVLAALGATIIDGAGNVLFMRAVRSWERSEMTGVFLTYRDASQLAPPGLFTVLLQFFALPVVFISAAAWMFLAAGFCRFIPKRM
jgi:predicted MFS family arabinose efflux permease